jgi:hypothetical protein
MEGIASWRKLPKKKSVYQNEKTNRLIQKIRESLDGGAEMGALVRLLMVWVKIQMRHKRSLSEIADGLNELEIPTTSGIGQWRAETIDYLISMHGRGRIPADQFRGKGD